MKKGFKILFLVVSLFSFISIRANESYDFNYKGEALYGMKDGKQSTALIKIYDNKNNPFNSFCIDNKNEMINPSTYTMQNILDATYFSSENANKIRNIVLNSILNMSLDEVKELSNIKGLKESEAIAGTQASIWHYSNNHTTSLSGNAKKLYDFYLSLDAKTDTNVPISDIIINKEVKRVNDKIEILFSFKGTSVNKDDSPIMLNYNFDELKGGVVKDNGIDENGFKNILVTNLPLDTKLKINVYGTQSINKDVYFLTSIEESQNLVTVYDNSVNIKKGLEVDSTKETFKLTIHKIDSLTLKPIKNVKFYVSNNSDFKNNVMEVVTSENGDAIVSGLNSGSYYIREEAMVGYMPIEEDIRVYINEKDLLVELKNSQLGKIKIIKKDSDNKLLEGVVFSLYKGKSLSSDNLISKDLITNDKGEILVSNLEPGSYTLVETKTIDGYILDNTKIYVDVTLNKTSEVNVVNEKTGYGSIRIIKRDVIDNKQLGGAKIGVYFDYECTKLYKEITTLSDSEVSLLNMSVGTYYLKELEAPDGYLNDSKVKRVDINKDDSILITFYNSLNYSTASNSATLFLVSGSLLMLVLTCFGIYKLWQRKRLI